MSTPPFPLAPGSPAVALPVELVFNGAFYQATGGGGGGGGAPYAATPLGYQQVALSATAQALTVPGTATFAQVMVEGGNARWRDDGTAPTASVGMLMYSGPPVVFSGDLAAVQFILATATAATLNVSYYK